MRLIKYFILLGIILFSSCDPDKRNYIPKDPVTQGRSPKRGVSFTFRYTEDMQALSPAIAWSYNWGASQDTLFDDIVNSMEIDFCPMAWNGINATTLRNYVDGHPDCKYLLGFNEPNMTTQANLTPAQAAQKWPALKSLADELGLKLISPAMNYGDLTGYSDPIVWLDEFFTLVSLDDVDGIAVHCYMPNASSVKTYIEKFKKYGKPIWLTEFCAWDGLSAGNFTAEGQQQYLSDMLNYLEGDPDIFRYAWFIPRGSGSDANFPYMFLLKSYTKGELTDLGKIFMQISTRDTSIYYVEQQTIEAEHYSSICISESDEGYWTTGPRVRVTSDSLRQTLELYNFLSQQWVEYQVQIDRDRDFTMDLRYATFIDTDLDIEVDGDPAASVSLANTVQDTIWNNALVSFPMEEGKHKIRFIVQKGRLCLNWFKIY